MTSTQSSWHALTAEEAAAQLAADLHRGLNSDEASARLARHGANRIPEGARRPAWGRFLLQFHNPLIYVLLASGAVTLFLRDYIDSGVILGVVVINALIGFVQEGRAEKALDAVRSLLATRATVLRDGQRRQIDAQELVPGDVVLLEPGDRVPADLRVTRAKNLEVIESALTGESVPVEKRTRSDPPQAGVSDRACMAYSGTLVAMGQGHGLVVATGSDTEIGRIGALVGEVQSLVTPLTRRLNVFSTRITVAILVVATATFLFGHLVARIPALEMFLAVVGLAVAAIPEGLPAVVTIILAIGTRAMARNRAVVRRLAAVETLGSVTVICSDKTGTLTRNEMTAVRVVLADRELLVSGAGYAPEGGFSEAGASIDPSDDGVLQNFVRCAALCNDAQLRPGDTGEWQVVGDPTEGALLTLARKADVDLPQLLLEHPRIDVIPFESDRRFMATLHRDHEGHHVVMLKGAPERVLALCVSQAGDRPTDLPYWNDAIHRAASAGERVLALAQCHWPADRTGIDIADITPRFELLGLIGIIDPPRDEAIAAVAKCQHAGIRVKMITGDHAVTAAAIGQRLGLSPGTALTGDIIEKLDDTALAASAGETDVFARASPEHKLRLIGALQSAGHLVAMTGDGVNDAPALKAADIGVAMGHKGTDAAREASDLVLTDDNFATIASAVREGRVVFDNIRKSLLFMLPTNGGQAGVIVISVFAGLALPVTAAQILWVNMVTAVTLALALAFEPAEAHVMSKPPRPVGEPLVTRAMATRILFVVALMVAAAFAVFEWELARGSSLATARTAAVNMLVAGEVVYLFNVRHFVASAWRLETVTGNRMALWVTGTLVALQMLFTYAPPFQSLFQSTALDLESWLVIWGLAAAKFVAVEAEKALRRRRPDWHL